MSFVGGKLKLKGGTPLKADGKKKKKKRVREDGEDGDAAASKVRRASSA